MKKLFAIVSLLLLALTLTSSAYAEWVNGYYRKDGTQVDGYYRTPRDGNPYNNKSAW